jgi:hypothetical protein
VTFLWGPVAPLNVFLVLGLAGSATSAYFVLLRWVTWKPAAYIGGLLYGFSPYMDGQGWGHFFLVFAIIPPLLLLVMDELVVTQRRRPVTWGVLLGLLVAAQLFISTEVLSSELVMGAAGMALLVCFCWRQARAHFRHAFTGLMSALVTFLVICLYPLWILRFGTEHISGPAQPERALAPYSADLVGLVVPMSNQAISHFQEVTRYFMNGNVSESDAYIGLTLMVVLVRLTFRYRHIGIVRFGAAMSAIALVLSLGSRLRVDGRITDVPLRARGIGPVPAGRKAVVACVAVAAIALVPLIPQWPYPMSDTAVPTFFRSPVEARIPVGSTLLTYPFPRSPHDQAMLWQVTDGLRYRVPGGYLITAAGPGRVASFEGVPSVTEMLLSDAYMGEPLPPLSPQILSEVRQNLTTWGIDTIVATPLGRDPGEATHLFTAALERSPSHVEGIDVWTSVAGLLRQLPHWSSRPGPTGAKDVCSLS